MPVCLHLKRSYSDVWRWAERHWRWLCAFLSLSLALVKYISLSCCMVRWEGGRHSAGRVCGAGRGSLEELVTSEMASWLLERGGVMSWARALDGKWNQNLLQLLRKPSSNTEVVSQSSLIWDLVNLEEQLLLRAGSDISGLASENMGGKRVRGRIPTYHPTPHTLFPKMHFVCSPLPPWRRLFKCDITSF